MLSNRMVRAEIKGVSSKMMARRGCFKRGVLSPLLWNMVINSLLGHLNNESLWDQTWCRGVGLSVNAEKTSMVLFTNNRKLVGFKKHILFGTEL
jgi:hypothetical protein